MTNAYLIYCRPGFEKEAASELQHHAARQGWNGFAKGQPDSAHVLFCGEELPQDGPSAPRWTDLVFARQWIYLPDSEPLTLDPQDRITPLVARLSGQSFRDLVLESPDTNDGNGLSGFFKAFGNTLKSVLDKRGILRKKATRTLHLFFLDSATVYIVSGRKPRVFHFPTRNAPCFSHSNRVFQAGRWFFMHCRKF